MNTNLILFTLLFLVSCGADVTSSDVKLAEEVCKDSDGLHHIETTFWITAICNHTKENKPRHRIIK